ncbi:MAG: nucleotide 5'-monophosphate nucleosidase PpnN [Pseudomonadota bacterium]
MTSPTSCYRIQPTDTFCDLSRREAERFMHASANGTRALFRSCALAVLNGGDYTDDATAVFDAYRDFTIEVIPEPRGIELEVCGAPASAFVDGQMIRGIRDLLYAVLRDICRGASEFEALQSDIAGDEAAAGTATTDAVFNMLRNANVLLPHQRPNLVVCWGGHSIPRHEYDYTKEVGYALGLRGLDICTGCGPGAMKGPMKGAHIGHAKQRSHAHRYLGITEPGIIAAESPNPIVNELVIMPDIEKRLEAFVRAGHGVIVFPGGVGTAEEILYLLGILGDAQNANIPFPLVFTGPASAAEYFQQIDRFIRSTLGDAVAGRYEIIIDEPERVANAMTRGIADVETFRTAERDAWHFNWLLRIPRRFQLPFEPTHENMANLMLDPALPTSELAANLRCAFSGIVSGNVKPEGRTAVQLHGPYALRGAPELMESMDSLLGSFSSQGRMKLGDAAYQPCYRIAAS